MKVRTWKCECLSLWASEVITVVTSRKKNKKWKGQSLENPALCTSHFPNVLIQPWVSQDELMERECWKGNGSVTLFHPSLQLFILSSQPVVWIICPHLITFDQTKFNCDVSALLCCWPLLQANPLRLVKSLDDGFFFSSTISQSHTITVFLAHYSPSAASFSSLNPTVYFEREATCLLIPGATTYNVLSSSAASTY